MFITATSLSLQDNVNESTYKFSGTMSCKRQQYSATFLYHYLACLKTTL